MYRRRICDVFNDDDCRDGSDLLHCNGKCFKNSFNAEYIKIVHHTYDFKVVIIINSNERIEVK